MSSTTLSFLGRDMAIDLGTANTLVYVRGRGIVLNEPSVVATNTNTGEILAVGIEAKRMIGRTPAQHRRGAPAEGRRDRRLRHHRAHAALLHPQGAPPPLPRPRPARRGLRAVRHHRRRAARGRRSRRTRPAPARCSSSRSRWPRRSAPACRCSEPTGNMVVDIGGGTTEVAVISLGGIVTNTSIRIAGDEIDQAIIRYVKKEYSLMLGERTAEEIKIAIGSAFPMPEETRPRSAAATWSPGCRRRSWWPPRRSAGRSRSRSTRSSTR